MEYYVSYAILLLSCVMEPVESQHPYFIPGRGCGLTREIKYVENLGLNQGTVWPTKKKPVFKLIVFHRSCGLAPVEL